MTSPAPGAYSPLVSARFPLDGRPAEAPQWRVLVHRKYLDAWGELAERCGDSNAEELWRHLSLRPDHPPLLGTCTPMKGRLGKEKDGWSRVYHYELTGAARVDYRHHAKFDEGLIGDEHRVVQIVSIDYGSH